MKRITRTLFKVFCFIAMVNIGLFVRVSFRQRNSNENYNSLEYQQDLVPNTERTEHDAHTTGGLNTAPTTVQAKKPKPPTVAGRFDPNYKQSPRNVKAMEDRYFNQLRNKRWNYFINAHLTEHKKLCKVDEEKLPEKSKPYCPCIPGTLLKFVNISDSPIPSLSSIKEVNPNVQEGGHWAPSSCTPRMRVAIVIPFRNRDAHLAVLLKYLLPVLQGQQLEYTIIVVEQVSPATFNKAVLMNIGYLYANSSSYSPNCVIFHDVDLIPEDGRHFYWCHPQNPLHLGAFNDRHHYMIRYHHIFGAAQAFRPWQFEKVNGYSNLFFGWGGEDDDMGLRVWEKGFKIQRDPKEVAGYAVLRHGRDTGNEQPSAAIHAKMRDRLYNKRRTDTDGLNSVKYKIRRVIKLELYTLVQVDVLNEDLFKEYRHDTK